MKLAFDFNFGHKKSLLQLTVLVIAVVIAFAIRLFAVIRFESIIHEYDPYFNYRTTRFMAERGFYFFHNWFDDTAWYPLGRIIGGTIYPGLMITSSLFYYLLNALHMTIDIRNICVFLAPLFASFTTIITFLLTKEIKDIGSGLLAASMVAIVPGYISRSVAGSYDNEGIAIFCMLFTFYCWIKSVKSGSIVWAGVCSLAYFYMVSSWGGYVFLINLIPIHVLILMICGRFSHRIYVAYSTFYCLGTMMSMQISFIGFLAVISSEHMLAFGVFGLCQLIAFYEYLRSKLSSDVFYGLLRFCGMLFFVVVGITGVILSYSGKIAPWTGRFYSLLDPTYAKKHIPIIASVSEHQPTSWCSYYFDFQFLAVMFPVGLYFCFKHMTDAGIFLIAYGMLSLYFSGVMVRLILVLAPVMCILGAVGISGVLQSFMSNVDSTPASNPKVSTTKQYSSGGSSLIKSVKVMPDATYPFRSEIASFVIVVLVALLLLFGKHCIWVTSTSYSHPSIVLESYGSRGRYIIDDYRSAYYWLRQNTKPDAKIMSWWDYGYQIAAIANRTVLVDNNTWNNTHIGRVGQAMASNEHDAYEIMRELDVDYVLIIFGGHLDYSSDDINKFIWMIRIAGSTEKGKHVDERDYFTPQGDMRVDKKATRTMQNSLLYKLSYYRFWEAHTDMNQPLGYDRVRGQVIGYRNYDLESVEEAFTSENWMVRIYRVKPLSNRGVS